jgi:hypothetical protein
MSQTSYNVIGDIAGRFDELMLLLDKMPKADVVLSIGDMIDRHDQSEQVVAWFMKNGKALKGNHEHMMLDYYNPTNFYQSGLWEYNGGTATLCSFQSYTVNELEKVLNWMTHLPLYLDDGINFISHSFLYPGMPLENACDINRNWQAIETSIIWNRREPVRLANRYQIAGHNSQIGYKEFSDKDGAFALCIDDSSKKILTGYNTDTGTVFQQPYIQED